MEAHELKAWRAANKLTQAKAADVLGVQRPQYANYESGARKIPDEVAARVPADGGDGVKSIVEKVTEQVKAELNEIPPAHVMKGARRPTAREIREHPQRFSGPNVWVVDHKPPEKLKGGQIIRQTILKGPSSGLRDWSVHLVGKGSGRRDDKEALPPGGYRPFTPALGIPLDPRGPKDGRKKAA